MDDDCLGCVCWLDVDVVTPKALTVETGVHGVDGDCLGCVCWLDVDVFTPEALTIETGVHGV